MKFPNFSHTSTLIAPVPLDGYPDYRYSSIGPFIKKSTSSAEKNQVNEVIRQIALEGLGMV